MIRYSKRIMSIDSLFQFLNQKVSCTHKELVGLLKLDEAEMARFVSEKLNTIDEVLSTATHFLLKAYEVNDFIFEQEEPEGRLAVKL